MLSLLGGLLGSLLGSPLIGLTLLIQGAEAQAPVSALVWWIIPITALVGGLGYAYWVTRLKSRYDNQTERSVGRFRKFQQSFDQDASDERSKDRQ